MQLSPLGLNQLLAKQARASARCETSLQPAITTEERCRNTPVVCEGCMWPEPVHCVLCREDPVPFPLPCRAAFASEKQVHQRHLHWSSRNALKLSVLYWEREKCRTDGSCKLYRMKPQRVEAIN